MSELANTVDLRSKIVDRIRATFVELIPQDQWHALVAKEIAHFCAPPVNDSYYHKEAKVSSLATILREELDKMFRAMVLAELGKPEYQTSFNNRGETTPSAFVQQYIEKHASLILKAAFAGAINAGIDNLRNQLGVFR